MKFGKNALWFFKKYYVFDDKRRMSTFKIDDHFRNKLDIPYIEDNNELHKFDLYYADENIRKRVCVIDIHGGSFIFGSRKNTRYYKDVFLNNGFDFIALDYRYNDTKSGLDKQILDCVTCLNYIAEHKKELDLQDDIFFLTGDSAGGYLSLFVTLLQDDIKLANEVNIHLNEEIHLRGTLVSCTVYDLFKLVDEGYLNESGQKRMFGPGFIKDSYKRLYSPSTHINNMRTPIFASTCRNDFLREHSIKLKDDLIKIHHHVEFYDIYTSNKKVSHVHNVNFPDYPESKEVNKAMVEFIKRICQKY